MRSFSGPQCQPRPRGAGQVDQPERDEQRAAPAEEGKQNEAGEEHQARVDGGAEEAVVSLADAVQEVEAEDRGEQPDHANPNLGGGREAEQRQDVGGNEDERQAGDQQVDAKDRDRARRV